MSFRRTVLQLRGYNVEEKEFLFRNAFVVFFILNLIGASLLTTTHQDCSWLVDTVNFKNIRVAVPFIQGEGKYFLRLRVQCFGQVNSVLARSMALKGLVPQVTVEQQPYGTNGYSDGWSLLRLSGALVELGAEDLCACSSSHCSCKTVSPVCGQATLEPKRENGRFALHSNCSDLSELCNPAWLVPLPLDSTTLGLHCHVTTNGLAAHLKTAKYLVHVDRYHSVANDSYQSTLGTPTRTLSTMHGPVSLSCMTGISPLCILGGFHHSPSVIYTASEFADFELIEVKGLNGNPDVCSGQYSSLSVVKGAVTLLDRVLLNTPAGIKETRASSPGSSLTSNLKRCIKQIVFPRQPSFHSIAVLAWGERNHKELVFVAYPERGLPLQFSESKDNKSANACQMLRETLQKSASWPCEIISGDVNGAKHGVFLLLIKLGMRNDSTCSYHVVQYSQVGDVNGTWKLLFSFPTLLDDSEESRDGWKMVNSEDSMVGTVIFQLTGLSFTTIVGDHLFVWGDILLYSPDGGVTIQWLTSFPRDSHIDLLTTSSDGTYVFITNNSQLWIGQIGSAKVQLLQNGPYTDYALPGSVANSTTLAIFFDSHSVLYQIVSTKDLATETDCLMRVAIPLGSILAHQNFLKMRRDTIKERISARKNFTSCTNETVTSPNPFSVVRRSCPFAWLRFEAPRDSKYLHRRELTLRPPLQPLGNLVYPSSAIDEYYSSLAVLSETAAVSTNSSEDRRGVTIQRVTGLGEGEYQWGSENNSDELPKMIFLGRSEEYKFKLYLYLDYDSTVGTSFHSWTLEHLQVSLHVSDPSVLRVRSHRRTRPPYTAVTYEIIVYDGEKMFPQRPPGEGLVPASLHIQVWNSAHSCISQSEDHKLQGSYVLTVLLGCPPSKKIVFDANASKEATGKSHYCSNDKRIHCFLYERQFLPVFREIDLATGEQKQFEGTYRLTVVGGGREIDSIRDYTRQEQQIYNVKGPEGSTSSLIWAAVSKTLGDVPSFNKSTSAMRWLCGTQSPCTGIDPRFPKTAEFYFKLQFSTRDVDAHSSNCDHTIQFYVRIHGLPPGPFYPATVIVLSCLGIMITLIMASFVFTRKNHRLWKQTKHVAGGNVARLSAVTNHALTRLGRIGKRGTGQASSEDMEMGDPAPPVIAWTSTETEAAPASDVVESADSETTL